LILFSVYLLNKANNKANTKRNKIRQILNFELLNIILLFVIWMPDDGNYSYF